MKLDKDTLIKNKFWVVLAVAAPLSLITIFVLITVVSGQNAKKRNEVEKKQTPIAGTCPNEANIEERGNLARIAEGKKSKFWQEAWMKQEAIFDWTKDFEKVYQFNTGYFATKIKILGKDPLGTNDATHFNGKILDVGEEYIVVRNDKEKKERKFRTTTKLVMDDPSKKFTEFKKLEPGLNVEVTYQQYRDFYDKLTQAEYVGYMKDYKKEVALWDILNQVNPVIEESGGVVLLGNGPLKRNKETDRVSLPPANSKFFRYVGIWSNVGDISEDVWLAQEDLWIQKELYYRVKLANESVSNFELVEVDGKPVDPKKPFDFKNQSLNQKFTFQNPYWKLVLSLQKDKKIEYEIFNLLPRRQKLSVNFLVQLTADPTKKEKITIEGLALDSKPPEGVKPEKEDKKTEEIKKAKDDKKKPDDVKIDKEDKKKPGDKNKIRNSQPGTIDVATEKKDMEKPPIREGIYGVEQVLTSDTAAVKRIDMVSLGDAAPEECSHSHRTFPEKLRAFILEEKKIEEPKDPGKDPRGIVGKGTDKDLRRTENGLIKDRYLEVTEEARRIPVAIVLIVDQEQIDRVLTSFRNSPLRFLMTQVLLNRYPYPLQSSTPLQQQGPVGPKQFDPYKRDFKMGINPIPTKDPVTPEASAGDVESNVEMVIYGMVTLYNRHRGAPAAISPK